MAWPDLRLAPTHPSAARQAGTADLLIAGGQAVKRPRRPPASGGPRLPRPDRPGPPEAAESVVEPPLPPAPRRLRFARVRLEQIAADSVPHFIRSASSLRCPPERDISSHPVKCDTEFPAISICVTASHAGSPPGLGGERPKAEWEPPAHRTRQPARAVVPNPQAFPSSLGHNRGSNIAGPLAKPAGEASSGTLVLLSGRKPRGPRPPERTLPSPCMPQSSTE
jgi:hypothetical protein